MRVRAVEVSTRAREVATSAMMGAILTAWWSPSRRTRRPLTKTPKMVSPTAFGESGRTRTGMAAEGLLLGAEMALAVTGVLFFPLRLVASSKLTP